MSSVGLGRKIAQSRVTLLLLSVAVALSLVSLFSEVRKRSIFQKNIEKLQADISALEQEQNRLSSILSYVSSDSYVEAESRKTLSVAKPGETIVVIEEQLDAESPQNATPASPFLNWWFYLFGDDR